MPDFDDYELHPTPGGAPEPPSSSSNAVKWIVLAILVIAAVCVVWFAMSRRSTPAPPATETAIPPAAAEPQIPPLGTTPEAVEVPALDVSDGFVREAVRRLSSQPTIAAWLATDGLIRNFTVVVSTIADGKTPARQLRAVKPDAAFLVADRGGQLTIDPRSYARYDRYVDALASIDPAGAARLYATLKPRIEEAYRDLGFPNTPFDRTLTRAIVILLKTPTIDRPIAVKAAGATAFAFADPTLETLPGAQRQLLRMADQLPPM
jgi:hypothetical protein